MALQEGALRGAPIRNVTRSEEKVITKVLLPNNLLLLRQNEDEAVEPAVETGREGVWVRTNPPPYTYCGK